VSGTLIGTPAVGDFACILGCPPSLNNWAIEITVAVQSLPPGVQPLGEITTICSGTNMSGPCNCFNCGT
jgi:hypothetical protein